jgi:uncharacterized protein
MGTREISLLTFHRVRVEDIPETGLDLHFSDPREEWNQYFEEIRARHFSISESVKGKIQLGVAGKAIQIHGWVQTGLDLECSRCLKSLSCPMTSQIDVTLFPETGVALEEEIELGNEDLKTSFFSGEEIDLSKLIREQIILNVPYKALCHEECRGLCPRCGANLNEGDCGCEGKALGSAFDVLRNLKLNGK